MSDPFTFMATLVGCLGSLHTISRYKRLDELFKFWREFFVIFMAIFAVTWKYRKEIFYKKVKKNKKTKKTDKKGHAKKITIKKNSAKKAYSTKSHSKLRKRKVTFCWIGEWFGSWIGYWIKRDDSLGTDLLLFSRGSKKFKEKFKKWVWIINGRELTIILVIIIAISMFTVAVLVSILLKFILACLLCLFLVLLFLFLVKLLVRY